MEDITTTLIMESQEMDTDLDMSAEPIQQESYYIHPNQPHTTKQEAKAKANTQEAKATQIQSRSRADCLKQKRRSSSY
jgi:hypothetical protein